MSLLDRDSQLALRNVLNLFVNGENNIYAMIALRLAAIEPSLVRVGHYNDFFFLASNQVVVFALDSTEPLFVDVYKAQHVSRQLTLRVVALIFLLKVNPFQVQ